MIERKKIQIVAVKREDLCLALEENQLLAREFFDGHYVYYDNRFYHLNAFTFRHGKAKLKIRARLWPKSYCMLVSLDNPRAPKSTAGQWLEGVLHSVRGALCGIGRFFKALWEAIKILIFPDDDDLYVLYFDPDFAFDFSVASHFKGIRTKRYYFSEESLKHEKVDRESFREYLREKDQLPNSFSQLLRFFIEKSGRSREDVAAGAGISPRNLTRLTDGKAEQQPKLSTVIALCLSLHLFPNFSEKLIQTAGYSLRNTEEGEAYQTLIYAYFDSDLDECNCVLQELGIKPLGSDLVAEEKSHE